MIRTWEDAEHLAVSHMRQLGFEDAVATRTSGDGGVDVVAKFAVAQVKHYQTGAIGAPAVQQLRGAAHKVRWPLFYTSLGYTPAAVSFADEAGVALFVYSAQGGVRAFNGHARDLVSDGMRRPEGRGMSSPILHALTSRVGDAAQSTFDSAGNLFAKITERGLAGGVAVTAQDVEEAGRQLDRELVPLGGEEVRDIIEVIRILVDANRVILDLAQRAGLTEDEVFVLTRSRPPE